MRLKIINPGRRRMEWGTIAGTLTAVATLITALGGLAVTMKVLIPNFRTNKETHKIVNQEKTNRDNFNRALVRALDAHGIEVPIDQSLPPAPAESPKE